ncbi:3-dehydroshikimate dehydratase [Piedraia hortae CBS 480.64]|uniref:3-dehydroshikimate dehydratase n=1 Tax=Piedraia hortae CBS 480.64 TaxID=1314780 RepID=A0A6A7CB95_9PEZI|nr:3-dehydroshikimate dehydratase [Piedraia hortae CBS 480.64]
MVCKKAISSHSLGRAAVHDFTSKLNQAARYGFDLELFYEDLQYVAKSKSGSEEECLLEAARDIRTQCKQRCISIICLQPFMHYEGLRDRQKHAQRIKEMELWIQLALELHTPLICIPSSFLPESEASGDLDLIVADLREVADLAAPHGLLMTYESLAWGTHSDTWERSWEIVQRVDRHNFGLCLDTFNMAGRVYADPAVEGGRTPNAEADMAASLRRLVQDVDVSKVFFVQVVDAAYLSRPLDENHEYYVPGQPARMSWSRNCRLFYGEHDRGAYLPIAAILKAILVDLGYHGYVSAELFSASLFDPSPDTPAEHARRATISWRKIERDFLARHMGAQL